MGSGRSFYRARLIGITALLRQASLPVVGANFPNKRGPTRCFEIALCLPGERVDLVPEPKNPADEHAIAVFSIRGVQLGYLPSERAVWIGTLMRQGREVRAVFQAVTPYGAAIRLAFDGEEPVLPPPRPTAPAGEPESQVGVDDFWPDPIYDD